MIDNLTGRDLVQGCWYEIGFSCVKKKIRVSNLKDT